MAKQLALPFEISDGGARTTAGKTTHPHLKNRALKGHRARVPDGAEKLQFNSGNPCSDLRGPASIYSILSEHVSIVLTNAVTNRNSGLSNHRRRERQRSKVSDIFCVARPAIAFTECTSEESADRYLRDRRLLDLSASLIRLWDNMETVVSEDRPRQLYKSVIVITATQVFVWGSHFVRKIQMFGHRERKTSSTSGAPSWSGHVSKHSVVFERSSGKMKVA
jgi:hypothetical protein